jgi:hypothetical protein
VKSQAIQVFVGRFWRVCVRVLVRRDISRGGKAVTCHRSPKNQTIAEKEGVWVVIKKGFFGGQKVVILKK